MEPTKVKSTPVESIQEELQEEAMTEEKIADVEEKPKKKTKKQFVSSGIQQGGAVAARAGDFFARLGALMVLVVATINTCLAVVTNFVDEVYWAAGLYLGLLLFIHLPVLIFMLVMMLKARVAGVINRVRPRKKTEPIMVKESPVIVNSEGVDNASKQGKKKSDESKKDKKKTDDTRLRNIENNKTKKVGQINKAFDVGIV
ncbi:uncharacterized protein LOC101862806 [Aplysia californica]|uniref:Uncharacterized protein LOC101862806 n=1 Tax=Aplysia californica TaxID=6500 RepID=A0ABM0JTN0_APLCA|nr:uncharacterized protein LOC101862806 [Aplysia californica]